MGVLIEGEIALQRGDPREAIRILAEAADTVDTWPGHLALGRAYLDADAFTEAHSEFDAALRRRGEAAAVFLDDVPSYRIVAQVHYYLGRAEEGLNSPSAADRYQAFIAIKQNADDDPTDPMVGDARGRLERR